MKQEAASLRRRTEAAGLERSCQGWERSEEKDQLSPQVGPKAMSLTHGWGRSGAAACPRAPMTAPAPPAPRSPSSARPHAGLGPSRPGRAAPVLREAPAGHLVSHQPVLILLPSPRVTALCFCWSAVLCPPAPWGQGARRAQG